MTSDEKCGAHNKSIAAYPLSYRIDQGDSLNANGDVYPAHVPQVIEPTMHFITDKVDRENSELFFRS